MNAEQIQEEINCLKLKIEVLESEIKDADIEGNEAKATRKSNEKIAFINQITQLLALTDSKKHGEGIILYIKTMS